MGLQLKARRLPNSCFDCGRVKFRACRQMSQDYKAGAGGASSGSDDRPSLMTPTHGKENQTLTEGVALSITSRLFRRHRACLNAPIPHRYRSVPTSSIHDLIKTITPHKPRCGAGEAIDAHLRAQQRHPHQKLQKPPHTPASWLDSGWGTPPPLPTSTTGSGRGAFTPLPPLLASSDWGTSPPLPHPSPPPPTPTVPQVCLNFQPSCSLKWRFSSSAENQIWTEKVTSNFRGLQRPPWKLIFRSKYCNKHPSYTPPPPDGLPGDMAGSHT